MKFQVRQGDVLIEDCEIPEGATRIEPENGRLILARGEATGHHHSVSAKDAMMMTVGKVMYLEMLRDSPLEHQEHREINIPKKSKVVIRQMEYTPERIKTVED